MNLLDVVREVRRHLEENGRLSLRMLRRQFELDDDALEEVIEELVDIQRVARREENALAWSAATPAVGIPPPARDPRSYTPKHLADKVLQSKSALEGERKQVTILFADVRGSTELASELDPEEWHRIMDRFFQILAEGVHRFEGTVNEYRGDGIMALFGAPIAHEDHAQRACYAALRLRDALRRYADELRIGKGINFAVRMGLNSGEVVVGKIGDDLRMDYTALGHTANLAARMEQIAEPGRIYLAEATAQICQGFFALRDLGRHEVRGLAQPVGVFELEGVGRMRTRLEVSRSRGFSKFVGRQSEMAVLEAALTGAVAGSARVIGVVAEAGVGKSRLCDEFTRRARAQGIAVYDAHCVAHGKMIPFFPILEMLRGYFGIMEQEGDEAARRKIAGTLLLLDPDLTDALPLLLDFLGVPDTERPAPRMDPEARQRQLSELTRRLVHARSRREPAVLLIDDLHWIDGGSEGFVETIIEALPGTRTLFLVNFRPEYHAAWMQRSYYQQLPLLPLGPEAIAELLAELLGTGPSLAGLAERVRERTGGNPFFIEEVVQSLVDQGVLVRAVPGPVLTRPVIEIEIPSTVQAVLAARIDRLPEREKQVLHTAAVIGREFAEPVLRRVAELPQMDLAAALHTLRASEFVSEEALYPQAEYAFKHPLTHEVAYRSQLGERQSRTHAAVARAIEELYPEQLDERAALLAHHWEEAGDRLEAARWHRRAAQWAGLSDPREGLRHWRRVRELARGVGDVSERTALTLQASIQLLSLGWRMGYREAEAAAVYEEGRALAERAGDRRALALLVGTYGLVRVSIAGSALDYVRYGEEAARIAAECGDSALRAAVGIFPTFGHFLAGDGRAALKWSARVLEEVGSDNALGKEIIGFSPRAGAFMARVPALTCLGRLEEAWSAVREAERVAEESRELEVQVWGHMYWVNLAYPCGGTESVLERGRRSLEIAEKFDVESFRVFAYFALGTAYLIDAQPAAACETLRESVAIARDRRSIRAILPVALPILAEAHLALGERTEALAMARDGIDLGSAGGCRYNEAQAQLALAGALLATDGVVPRVEIESALERAERLVESIEGRSLSPRILEMRGRLAAALGDAPASDRALRQALELYRAIGATGHAGRLARELGA